ncbi:hypothetical protein DdX_18054 [Ditylenchus destructor]|uniref:Uncharacterized protein n=1 Tax=Ditylenchus destructor TaxID=166010 RepID=A0AAD4MN11_9BILA|nr:hypothetical protein DdX_18054 [Ditylenchus destructor]
MGAERITNDHTLDGPSRISKGSINNQKLVQEEVKAPQHQQQQALVLAYKSCAHYPLHIPLDRPPRWQEYPPPRKGHPTKRSTETRNCQLQTGNNQQPG